MREFADASREVDATDCAADGDPRELLQRKRARVEVMKEFMQAAVLWLILGIILGIRATHVARHLEANTANAQAARMQLAASEAERQKLIRNAKAAFARREDEHSNQPELAPRIELWWINITKIFPVINDVSVK